MEASKLYFRDEDSTHCQSLEAHIQDAQFEELTEIELMEANPDDGKSGFIWCTEYGDTVDRGECKKSLCSHYHSKSGRGVCSNRGNLYWHGEKVKFDVPRINKQIGE